MLSGFLYIVPTHLSTVLFALAAADPKVIARKLRVSLRLSALIGLAGMAVLGVGAHLALSLFGPSYARAATVTLWLLVIGYVPTVFKVHYIAVCRASGRIPRAAAVLTLAAVAEVAAAAVGGAAGQASTAWPSRCWPCSPPKDWSPLPPVIRAAIGHGGHRRPAAAPGGVIRETADKPSSAPA